MHRSRVLILNASYEPLQLVPVQSALRLVLRDKAEVIESGEGQYRSERCALDAPLVIRLNRYVHRPHVRAPCTRRAVLMRDDFTCQYCSVQLPGHLLTLDHVVPRARGGATSWENVVAACKDCNGSKGNRLPQEAKLKLRRKPSTPSWTWLLSRAIASHPVWSTYNVV
jgi:5-methylcytosine-specific restriction endonuclease McrA